MSFDRAHAPAYLQNMARVKYILRLGAHCPLSYPEKEICANHRDISLLSIAYKTGVTCQDTDSSSLLTRFSHYAKPWKRPTKYKSTHIIFLSTIRQPSTVP